MSAASCGLAPPMSCSAAARRAVRCWTQAEERHDHPHRAGRVMSAAGGRGAPLKVTDLHSGYGAITVLHGVSISCAPGEVLGITGPNGAGKTTLLNTLAGLISPSRGSIVLDDVDLVGRATHRRV